MIIGVLAVQGDFREHCRALQALGVDHREVRLPLDLDGIDGIIVPGGESTTIARLMRIYELDDPIRTRVRDGNLAYWGTCAGMIVAARTLTDARPTPLGLIDIVVSRNAFGRQVDSFEAQLEIGVITGGPVHAVFIRAPVATSTGPDVEVLATIDDGGVVAARSGRVLVSAFHPELTDDLRLHALFVDLAAGRFDGIRLSAASAGKAL